MLLSSLFPTSTTFKYFLLSSLSLSLKKKKKKRDKKKRKEEVKREKKIKAKEEVKKGDDMSARGTHPPIIGLSSTQRGQ